MPLLGNISSIWVWALIGEACVWKRKTRRTIREYTQRWRETATWVDPPLLEKEMINLFVNTFKAPYFEYLVGSSTQHFSDLVAITERIEQAIHLGRIADSIEEKHFTREKKETEVHNVKGRYKNDRKSYQNKDI
jgi:hypothetical protein